MTPEECARETIDELLGHAGWDVQGRAAEALEDTNNLPDPDIIAAELSRTRKRL
jgi:type I site-specific restriction endonuclease